MDTFVFNRTEFENLLMRNGINEETIDNYREVAFISIINPGDTHPIQSTHNNLCNLVFDDVTPAEDPEKNGLVLFNEDHAKQIIEFVERNRNCKIFYVHCAAGTSRSGAVGLFINDVMEGNYFDFTNRNGRIKPNFHIYTLLKRTYNEQT